MSDNINIYCNESCHFETDGKQVMKLGAISGPLAMQLVSSKRLREIKARIQTRRVMADKKKTYTQGIAGL